MDEQGEFMESDVTSSTKSIVDPKVKVRSPNSIPLLFNYLSLPLNSSLLTHSKPANCGHFSIASKSCLSIGFVLTYFANDWTRNFDKLKWALTFVDAGLYFSHVHFSDLYSKAYDRLLRAFMGFDLRSSLMSR